jgi:hypothetical protein
MLSLWRVGPVVALWFAHAAWAQIDARTIEQDLKEKPMALRSYSAEPVVRYEWVNDKFVAAPTHFFTPGMFTTRSVKLKGDVLIVEGARGTLVGDVNKKILAVMGESPTKLEIDLHNAPATLALPMLEDLLFFQDASAAVADLPIPMADMLPADAHAMPKTRCDCKRIFDGGSWIELGKSAQVIVPRLKSAREPEFSDEARDKKISGATAVVIFVNNTGHVEDVWLAHALGFGLDGQAFKTVRQYVFHPATYEERPVGVILTVEVKFQSK